MSSLNKLVFLIAVAFLLLSSATKAEEAQPSSTSNGAASPPSTAAPNPDAQKNNLSEDEIFQRAFKKKKRSDWNEVPLNVFYDREERSIGILNSLVDGSATGVKLNTKDFIEILKKYVSTPNLGLDQLDAQSVIESKFGEKKWIPLSYFDTTTYKITYDSSRLELRLTVPPEIRIVQAASLSNMETDDKNGPVLEPDLFSAFVNMNVNQDFQTSSITNAQEREPLRVRFDSGVNIASWVLESNADYVEPKGSTESLSSFWRNDVRVIKDYTTYTLRQTMGDLNYPIRGLQSYRPMGGVSIYSLFGIDPKKLTNPTGNYELVLKRPSRVLVFVNNQQRQILDLDSGRHDLRDFPLTGGLNDLRLEITNDLGEQEIVNMSFFSSSDLLRTGLHQYSISVGAPTHIDAKLARSYDFETPTLSSFHRYGVTDSFTIGSNLQKDPQASLLGLEGLFASKVGFFRFEPVLSDQPGRGLGFATSFRYQYSDYNGPESTQRNFRFGIDSRSPYFSPFVAAGPINIKIHEITLGFGQALSTRANINLNFSYNVNRKIGSTNQNSYSFGAGFNRQFSSSTSASFNISQSSAANGKNDASISFFFKMNMSKDRQFVTTGYNPKDDLLRGYWSMSPDRNIGGVGAQLGLEKKSDRRAVEGKIQYTNERGMMTFTHRNEWTEPNTGTTDTTNTDSTNQNKNKTYLNQRSSAQLAFALVSAGGHFGITRPVIDSFVMVNQIHTARGQTLEINPQKDGTSLASSNWLGPAVLPELPSYNFTPITLGTQKFGQGASIGQDHFNLHPSYKSGYSIEVGNEATITIALVLLTPEGQGIALQPGAIVSVSDPTLPPITAFTGRRGQMRVEGLKPGKYEIKLYDEKWESYPFEVTEEMKGYLDMGNVQMKPRNP